MSSRRAWLEPGGQLVAIVGRGMRMGDSGPLQFREGPGRGFSNWWTRIGREYDVPANVGVPGKAYGNWVGTSRCGRGLEPGAVVEERSPSVKGAIIRGFRGAALARAKMAVREVFELHREPRVVDCARLRDEL